MILSDGHNSTSGTATTSAATYEPQQTSLIITPSNSKACHYCPRKASRVVLLPPDHAVPVCPHCYEKRCMTVWLGQ